MTKYEELEQYAYDRGIKIINKPAAGLLAVAAMHEGKPIIFLDLNRIRTEAERLEALAHELGHIETGAFQSKYTKHIPRGKVEHRAWIWAIHRLLPEHELQAVIADCGGRLWEVAEELGVPENLIRRAILHYWPLAESA